MSKILPSRFPTKLIPRVDFVPEEFRKMIRTHGLLLEWEMAAQCACNLPGQRYGLGSGTTSNQGNKRTGCPTCKGSGFRYHSKQEIRGLITAARQNPRPYNNYGAIDIGSVSLSVNPEHRLNKNDRITVLESTQRYTEKHLYEGGTISALRYPIVVRTVDTVPPQTFGVIDCYATDVEGIAQVGGEKVEGVDFTVTNGQINWINRPDVGAYFAVSYYARPVYIVRDLPHPYRDTNILFKNPTQTFVNLPLNVICALESQGTGSQDNLP